MPAPISAEATGPQGAAVTFSTSAMDLVDGSVLTSASPVSGSIFPLGTTSVTVSATDAHGNTATKSFNVTVHDTTAPVITVPAPITVEATGSHGAMVTFSTSAMDLVDGSVLTSASPASGSTFPLGTTSVTVSATDAHGNTATKSFNVTVHDTTPPTITVPAPITAEATGPQGTVVTFSTSAMDLVDGSVLTSASPASGSIFPLGTTSVTVSATDAHGNTAMNTFTVTVQDTTAPVIIVPAPITVNATGPQGAVVTFSTSATDLVDGVVATTAVPASGSTFPLGTTPVTVSATDAHGNIATSTFNVTILNAIPPTSPVMDLSATDNTGPPGQHTTSNGRVTLVGHTDPGIKVALLGTDFQALATDTGSFQFPDVPLTIGANPFTAEATSAAGATADFPVTIIRVSSTAPPNPVIVWNQAALNAIEQDGTDPLFASRGLAMVQAAVFDSVNAIEGTPAYYVKIAAPAGASADAAVDAAAHDVLGYLYPGQQASLDALLAAQLALVPDGQAKADGEAVGQAAGNAIIAMRVNDGSQTFVDFTSGTAPGNWQPTPPAFAEPLDPQWANLTPFAMTSPDQFRPAGPPDLTSQQWADAVNQVESLGSATNSTRTAYQTQIAQFWNDATSTYTPPGHWNAIAATVAQQEGDGLASDARLFAELDISLADAGIAAWNTKYDYDTWRPVTVIQSGGDGVNPAVTADPTWEPLLTTPNFPEYVSGHSTFSGAAATVLDAFFGDNVSFTSTEETLPGVTRSFTSFDQAAQEAGMSRIYAGIHFIFSDTDGLATGQAVAKWDLGTFNVSQDTTPPKVTLDNVLPGGASSTNITITGQVSDTLSGVAKLEVQVDQGAYAPLAFNAGTGQFSLTTSFALDGSQNGSHTLNFRATDAAGNIAAPVPFTFMLGTMAPTLNVTSPSDGGTIEEGDTLTGTATTSGPALVALSYAFDGGQAMPVTFSAADGSFNQALDMSKLAAGAHTLSVTATDAAGNTTTQILHVDLTAVIPLMVDNVLPMDGSTDIGVTYRPKVTFSRAIDPTTLNAADFYATDPAGDKLPATIVPSDDGTYAWLFFSSPLPGASAITLIVDGSGIKAADGTELDAAMDGTPGSKLTETFTTVSVANVPGTSLTGIVADPGPDFKPMTRDDFRSGPDGVAGTADDIYLHPIAGALVYILGEQDQAVVSDAQGRFSFASVPTGDVKLVVDGTTAINAPDGYYFPQMVLDLTIKPGVANTAMGSMGTDEEQAANATSQGIYLPRLLKSILQPVSTTGVTHVAVTPAAAPDLTPQQQQFLSIDVQPGSLVDENGQKLTNAQIGISVVPPQLVMDMLPAGVLQHTLDITIQAPGAVALTTPAVLTFPNIFDAAPGTQLNFLSFDHTTGRLEIDGTATVSADGLSVTTDPGQGITHIGWHGLAPPGSLTGNPCDPTVMPTTNLTPQPVTAGIQNYYFADDNGQFLFSIGNATPPPAGADNPCSPANLAYTPMVVTITADGPVNDFLDGLNLTFDTVTGEFDRTIFIQAGTKQDFFVTTKKLLTDANIQSATEDRLYGATISVKATAYNDPSTVLLERSFNVYRFFDIADNNHQDQEIDFPKTFADGSDGVIQPMVFDLLMPPSAMGNLTMDSTSQAAGTNFQMLPTQQTLVFDPLDPPADPSQ